MARNRPSRHKTARRRSAGYHVDVPRSLAALITGTPELGEDAQRLLAHSVMHLMRDNPGSGRWARLLPDDPDDFVASLRELHRKGWMSVYEGRAYPSEPVYGPLGNVVDRVRMSDLDKRAAVQFFAGQFTTEPGGEVVD